MSFVLAVVGVYVVVVSGMFLAQTWMLFPTSLAALGGPPLPAAAERLEATTPDGERLVGTHLPPARAPEQPRPLILGFGGNAWNADGLVLYLHRVFPESDVVAFHYRGYSPSSGRPSASALLEDAQVVHDHVQERLAPEQVVAVGLSIGAGPAASLAKQEELAGVILVTPFDSLEALAREHYFWAPVGLLLRHRMEVLELMREVTIPAAVITAEHDTIVPARRTAPLREAIPNLVYDRTIAGADHNDLYERHEFQAAMREALARIEAAEDL